VSGWGIFETPEGDVHVAPADEDDRITNDHRLVRDCECRPNVLQSGGLFDTPFWSHVDPEWPGHDDYPRH
jgi:hypothetical protein